ncbi:hypothetical protein CP979_26005 [Streptomyces filamentosus]|nr:hypothetical protein CP979_26005 [Streptomyces filamentosus]
MAASPFQSTLPTKLCSSFAASLRDFVAFSRASPACSRSAGLALSSRSSIALSRWPSKDVEPKTLPLGPRPKGRISSRFSRTFVIP